MVNKELVNYIRKTKKRGFSIWQIRLELEKAGHSKHDIEDAITEVIREKSPLKEQHIKLLLIFLIGISAILSLGMVYKLINNVHSFNVAIDQGISGAAVKENVNCNDLEDKSRDWCYFNLAKNKQAKKYCNNINDTEIKDFCISVAAGEEIDCSKILDKDIVAGCT